MKIIYLRVSKEELDESLQLPVILKGYNLKESEVEILRERISAYQDDKQNKRKEFIRLKQMIGRKEISDLYVYSLERLERNMLRMFRFYFFCEENNCKIHGYLQPTLDFAFDDSPIGKFSRYEQLLLFGMIGENESYLTSQRTKKAFHRVNGRAVSSKGNLSGKRLKNIKGELMTFTMEERTGLDKRILLLTKSFSHKDIKTKIQKEYNGLDISDDFIRGIVKREKDKNGD